MVLCLFFSLQVIHKKQKQLTELQKRLLDKVNPSSVSWKTWDSGGNLLLCWSSTHRVSQQTQAFGKFTIDQLYMEIVIQYGVNQVFESLLFIFFVCNKSHVIIVLKSTILLWACAISLHKSTIHLDVVDCEILCI